jgi:hypothetical protein
MAGRCGEAPRQSGVVERDGGGYWGGAPMETAGKGARLGFSSGRRVSVNVLLLGDASGCSTKRIGKQTARSRGEGDLVTGAS